MSGSEIYVRIHILEIYIFIYMYIRQNSGPILKFRIESAVREANSFQHNGVSFESIEGLLFKGRL